MLTSIGYLLIALLVGGIMYTWLGEWRDMEGLEAKNREIDEFRKEVNNIHIHLIEFSLLGETILEWDDEDLGLYHARRMTMDSMLCRFKAIYLNLQMVFGQFLLPTIEKYFMRFECYRNKVVV